MEIAVIDDRHPFTVALAYGLETGRINPELEISIQNELQDLVSESTKKFVGFKNVESVYRGLDITLGILSLAVVHSTKGEEDFEKWLDYILEKGLKGVAKDAIAMAKEVSSVSLRAIFGPHDPLSGETLKDYLIKYATTCNTENKKLWVGYSVYQRDTGARKDARIVEELVKFLILKLLQMSQDKWLRIIEASIGDCEHLFSPGEILNNLLFRHCTKLPMKIDLSISRVEFVKVRRAYESNETSWIKSAKKRYDSLKDKIPKELHPGLFYVDDWFVTHIFIGPPKVPKNWNEIPDVPGVTGIYWYQMME